MKYLGNIVPVISEALIKMLPAFSLLSIPTKFQINFSKFKINMAALQNVIIDQDIFPLDIKFVLEYNRWKWSKMGLDLANWLKPVSRQDKLLVLVHILMSSSICFFDSLKIS